MNTNNRIEEIKKRLKQGKYYVPYAPDDIEYLLSELSKTRLERNQLEANKNYYKEQLAKAEAEGRLIVLPCKVGDTVYAVQGGEIIQCEVTEITICKSGISFIRLFSTDDRLADFRYEHFQKTVFLTREAAEKALTKGAEHHEV